MTDGFDEHDNQKSLGDQPTEGDFSRVEAQDSLSDQETSREEFLTPAGVEGAAGLGQEMRIMDLEERFEVQQVLGQGGMGEVIKARDKRLGRLVAIKRIRSELAQSTKALQRFFIEAKSVAALNHQHITQIYGMERSSDGPFLVMEYIEGGSLLDKLKEGPLPVEMAVDLICKVCDALAFVHERGIIHRDIKPANILLTVEGQPKLTDFGLARQETVDHGHTQEGIALGTRDFMSPEQECDASAVDARSDLWSLAATLYQIVTAQSPRIMRFDQLPPFLIEVLAKALKESPNERFQSAVEMRDALRSSLATTAPVAQPVMQLAVGECPQCHVKNQLHGKFCIGCGAGLTLQCVSCATAIQVWENFCGECGVSQLEVMATRRAELEARRDEAETLRKQYMFVEALAIASDLAAVEDSRWQDLQEWSATFIETTEAEKRQLEREAQDQYVEAKKHREAFDYQAGIRALELIPEQVRNPEISAYLRQLKMENDESVELIQTIADRVKRRDFSGLMEQVTRAVELRGDREDLRALEKRIVVRQAEEVGERDEAFNEAEELLEGGRAKKALARIDDIDDLLLRSADEHLRSRLKTIVDAEDALMEKFKEVILDDIIEPAEVVSLLAVVTEYLSLNPNHQGTRELREELSDKIRRYPKQYAEVPIWLAMQLPADVLDKLPDTEWVARTLDGHIDDVNSVVFSSDGEWLASGSRDKGVKLWDVSRGVELKWLQGHTKEVSSVAIRPESNQVASGSADETIKLWDVGTGQEGLTLKGHAGPVSSVAFSPDGKQLASGSRDRTVKFWDVETGTEILTLTGHAGYVSSVTFSPDGQWLATASRDNTVRLWDVVKGEQVLTLNGHAGNVTSVAFSPDGKRLASASWDNTVKLWDPASGQESLTLAGHSGTVSCVAFSPDGHRLATGGWDNSVKLWNAATGQELLTLKGHTGYVYSVAFSIDGRQLASGGLDKVVKIWSLSPVDDLDS